jgi:GxxExxY protein
VEVPLVYENVRLDTGYRLDLLVDDVVIVEVKAVQEVHDVHLAQLLTYLKLTGASVGLLVNFRTVLLKDGIHRLIGPAAALNESKPSTNLRV